MCGFLILHARALFKISKLFSQLRAKYDDITMFRNNTYVYMCMLAGSLNHTDSMKTEQSRCNISMRSW